jgi:hypothetical protein
VLKRKTTAEGGGFLFWFGVGRRGKFLKGKIDCGKCPVFGFGAKSDLTGAEARRRLFGFFGPSKLVP